MVRYRDKRDGASDGRAGRVKVNLHFAIIQMGLNKILLHYVMRDIYFNELIANNTVAKALVKRGCSFPRMAEHNVKALVKGILFGGEG